MIDVCRHDDPRAEDMLIEGPTIDGKFFIRNRVGDVWCGECFRGFGYARMFDSFREAFITVPHAREVRAADRAAWFARGCTVE